MIRRAIFVGLLAISGCGMCGSKEHDGPAATPATGPSGSGGRATAEAPATPPSPADADLARLPVESDLVIGVDVKRLVGSELWKRLVAPVVTGQLDAALASLKDRCGIDPLAQTTYVTAGAAGASDEPNGIAVVHGLAKAAVTACVDKLAADASPKLAVERAGDALMIKPEGGAPLAVQFTDDHTAVVGFGASATAQAIQAAVAGGSKLPTVPAFQQLYERVDRHDAVWFVMNGRASALDPLAQLGPRPKALYGSAATRDGLSVHLHAQMPTADAATKLATLLRQQAAPLLGLLGFDKLDVRDDGDDVLIALAVSAAKLPAMVRQIESMFGGMLGNELGSTP